MLQVEKPVRLLKEQLLQLKEMKIKTLACNENSTRALRTSGMTGMRRGPSETNGAKRKK